MTSEDVRDRLAALSAAGWVGTAVGVAVELGLPARLRAPAGAETLSAGDDERAVAARLRAVGWAGDTVEPERDGRWMEAAGLCDVALLPPRPSGHVPMRARTPAIA